MSSKFSVKCNKDHNKTFDDLIKPILFEYPIRRKSCYCQQCGNLGQFQQQNSNLPTSKEIQFSKQKRINRKLSFGDDIQTDFPSEFSQIESENGRRIRQNDKSFSISIKCLEGSLKFDSIYIENTNKIKRKSCECSECGKLNPFQIKNQEIWIPKKDRQIKQFQIKSQPKFLQYGSTEFQILNKKIVQKTIMYSPRSQRSIQLKQINEMRRTKDVKTLVNNRISTRDLELHPKQIQSKFSIINSCRQLDSQNIPQGKSQTQNTNKPIISFYHIK
ncbi:unnamed protein product [Paramecium pentaurelia]|uniref:Uncharacterized protein n=1 Tax=Paramecium pentaurelia TaxID=43138 RepID=A0A8S1V469_9CILI|nr:unnamed protein product [Paramecium pentaurelia]